MLAWLNPYRWLLMGALVAAVVLGVPILWHRHNAAQQQIGYDRRAEEDKAAALAQTASNRELGHLAELHLSAVATKQDRFFADSAKEIHDAAAPLSACPIPEPVRVRLNAAIECAVSDSAAACDVAPKVPTTGGAAGHGNVK